MRVLPLNCVSFQAKTNNYKAVDRHSHQQNPSTVFQKPDFKNNGAINAAPALGLIFGGAALALSAPVAIVTGALLLAAPIALATGAAAVSDIAGTKKPIKPMLQNMFKKV